MAVSQVKLFIREGPGSAGVTGFPEHAEVEQLLVEQLHVPRLQGRRARDRTSQPCTVDELAASGACAAAERRDRQAVPCS